MLIRTRKMFFLQQQFNAVGKTKYIVRITVPVVLLCLRIDISVNELRGFSRQCTKYEFRMKIIKLYVIII